MRERPLVAVCPLDDRKLESQWMLPGYFEALLEAGAAPFMLPLTDNPPVLRSLLEAADGLLLSGGQDVQPPLYGEEDRFGKEKSPERDAMEGVLLGMALEKDMPVLGICRGLQFLNVHLGGTLWQDLDEEMGANVRHRMEAPYDRAAHSVALEEGSPLAKLLGKTGLEVNSCHHQGIRELGKGLERMATAPDGLVEAVRMQGRSFVWAVQWHPEFSRKVSEDSRRIFRAFAQACQAPSPLLTE